MSLLQDFRYALRMLRTCPGFTAVAVLVLALGSGANTAVFSVLNAVVLRPLPYSNPARLYQIESMTSRGPRWFSVPDLASWREKTRVFASMASAKPCSRILSGVDEPEQLSGLAVSAECFPLLGTSPILGRWFGDEDFKAGATPSVIIGQRLWERRFHSDPNLFGKPIVLDGVSHTAIGIMPQEFQFGGRRTELWIPVVATAPQRADDLLALGEAILEIWLATRGETPTMRTVEGFRLLALHRQGARGEPSFNACRETCRELVFHHNLVSFEPAHADVARRLRLGAMVARHLQLFIGGKLEVAGLGEFCCSSRPLRQHETPAQATEAV